MTITNLRDHNVAIAAGLAVVAAVLTMIYVAHGGANGTAKAAAPAAGASVFVAARDIPVGTAASRLVSGGYVVRKRMATSDVAPGAITDRRQLAGLVAVQPVYAGEQLTERRFGQSGATGMLSDLEGATRVMQLSGDARQLLAGILKPGDHVDVLASVKRNNGTDAFGRIALRNLLVVDTQSSKSTAPGTPTNWVTLQLSDRQARTLFFIAKNGDWSLVLRPFVRPVDGPDSVVTPDSLYAGGR
jgi:pilus assembly protein CpaB